ncbi:uncharacterized protein [Salminus brasiliensis]|uniref:uncharacterized protein n=1 Tax=Salminus brasiliensis TaxID=930266 RepID=UPI003B839982
MKTAHLHFCLLLWCGAADGFTDLLVDLGQNVTLGCEIGVKNAYWFLLKPSHPTVHILRSFSAKDTSAQYSDQAFRERFSLKSNGSLFIQNITVNELGIYFCINNESSHKMSNGTRLYINENVNENRSQAMENQTNCNPEDMLINPVHLQTLLIVSGLLNFVLVITVTGMTVRHCKKTPQLQAQPADSTPIPDRHNLQLPQDCRGVQYEDIELPSTSGVRLTAANSTYALLQHPKPRRKT